MSVFQFSVACISATFSARSVVEEAAAKHAYGVHQCRVMKLVVLLRVFDVVVMDEAATEDLDLTLRIIWSTRSIHGGKREKEFYRYISSCLAWPGSDSIVPGHSDGSLKTIPVLRSRTCIAWWTPCV